MTSTIVLTAEEVRRLLPMAACIEVVADALRALSTGEALNPLRWGVRLPEERGLIGLMPGFLPGRGALGLKAIAYFPGNHGSEYDSHQGVVVLFDAEHGVPVGIFDASEITSIRTAAASAVATRVLAREDAGDLGLLGSGVQARSHLEAMAAVRKLRRVRVWSPDPRERDGFARRESGRHGVEVESVASAREAVAGSDLVCTATAAREPVLAGEWLAPGAHVNAVGACFAANRELDTAAVVRSRVIVDRRESALAEAGDLLIPMKEGAIDATHIAGELGDVLLQRVEGRRAASDVTLFKSLGIAVEDLAAAHLIHARARAQGRGVAVDFGGHRHARS
jgi:ornithine cyclodeaminase